MTLCQSQTPLYILSIHAAREGGDAPDAFDVVVVDLSIHAAREGGDLCAGNCRGNAALSIHAAREGGDKRNISLARKLRAFQSTPPVKAATYP